MQTRVSIQGYEGSFHQVAARQYFGKDVTVIPCGNFRDVVKIAGNKKESEGGVMAIENSIAGSILPNYNLLQKSNLKVTGEIYLQIRQHLLVNPGVSIDDIREVHSHPMAIQQPGLPPIPLRLLVPAKDLCNLMPERLLRLAG